MAIWRYLQIRPIEQTLREESSLPKRLESFDRHFKASGQIKKLIAALALAGSMF
jgi:hypothetical protein